MNTTCMNTGWKALLCAAALTGSALAMQPGRGGPDDAGGPPPREVGPRGERDPGMFDAGAIRARLERRLEEITREQSRLREALERLGRGESPEDVGRGLPMGRRPGRDGEPQGPGAGERPKDGLRGGPRGGPRDGVRGDDGERGGPGEAMRDARRGEGERAEGSPEEHEQLMALLRESMPRLAARIDEATKTDPEAGKRMMTRWAPRLREAAELKRHDPELFDLRMAEMRQGWTVIEASRAARELGKASHDKDEGIADKRTKAKDELKAALAAQFDARLAMQSHEVSALEKRLSELKGHLDEQRAAKDARVGETMDRILSDKDLPLEPGHPGERPPHPKAKD